MGIFIICAANPATSAIDSLPRHKISDYIDEKKGSCEVDLAPFAVFLNGDDRNYVEPDISVICDKNKLTDKG